MIDGEDASKFIIVKEREIVKALEGEGKQVGSTICHSSPLFLSAPPAPPAASAVAVAVAVEAMQV